MASTKKATVAEMKAWVREMYSDFVFDIVGFATSTGKIIPLDLEPGTLGNIIEGALIAHLKDKTDKMKDVSVTEGGMRHYPDLELTGEHFKNALVALDIKAARRGKNPNRTQSRITLYSFGTYLKHQDKKFPQTIRPFADYTHHIDLMAIFDVDAVANKVNNFELLVVEPWKVASHTASSATRDYVGAVMEIDRIREERGEFKTRQEFYDHWAGILRRGEKPLK